MRTYTQHRVHLLRSAFCSAIESTCVLSQIQHAHAHCHGHAQTRTRARADTQIVCARSATADARSTAAACAECVAAVPLVRLRASPLARPRVPPLARPRVPPLARTLSSSFSLSTIGGPSAICEGVWCEYERGCVRVCVCVANVAEVCARVRVRLAVWTKAGAHLERLVRLVGFQVGIADEVVQVVEGDEICACWSLRFVCESIPGMSRMCELERWNSL